MGLGRLRLVHSMRSAWEEVRKMRLRSPVSSKVQLHISNTLTISQRCKRSRLVIQLLFIRIVLLARGHSFEIRLPRLARDRRVSGWMPSSFPQPFELVHGMICLFKYAGILSLEKIVGSTVKMQYVRTRKAQPHSPSPMTLAGKGIFQSTRINQRLTCPCSILDEPSVIACRNPLKYSCITFHHIQPQSLCLT